MKKLATGIQLCTFVMLVWACSPEYSHPVEIDQDESLFHRLVGIIQSSPKEAGAVFEKVGTKKQKLYRIGEVIEGAIVAEIKHEEVLLRRGEKEVWIRLAKGSPGIRHPGDPIPIPVGLEDPRKALEKVLSKQIPPYSTKVEKKTVSRLHLGLFVMHFVEPPPTFVPTPVGPGLDLMQLDREVLKGLGLAPTDVVVGISGMGLDSSERSSEIFRILAFLQPKSVFNLSVLRGNSVTPLSYVIQSDIL